jgi:tellurite resistance protein TerC
MTAVLTVPAWIWAATIGALVLILGTELVIGIRHGAREVRLRSAAIYTVAVAGLAVLFGLGVAWLGHPAAASQFYAGWLTEYSLSLDNLFIFVLLIGRSAVPRELHSRVLLLGVVMALLLRGAFIAAGASAISRFSWVLYLFGALLLVTAVRLVTSRHQHQQDEPARPGLLMRGLARVVPVSRERDDGRLVVRSGGRLLATPLLFLILAIAATDLVFALDSIPAVFGLTRDPYLIFTANAFALLGLRQLYFLLGGLLGRLRHLSIGLAVILGFIGLKLIAEALAGSGVHELGPVPVPHVSTAVSLAVIGGVLATVTVTSLLADRRSRQLAAGPSEPAAGQPAATASAAGPTDGATRPGAGAPGPTDGARGPTDGARARTDGAARPETGRNPAATSRPQQAADHRQPGPPPAGRQRAPADGRPGRAGREAPGAAASRRDCLVSERSLHEGRVR